MLPLARKAHHARPGPHRTISRSGPRTETRNVPSTSAWFRDEACPRGSGTEVERPDDRRTEAWRRASGIAPCRQRRRRRTKEGLTRPIRHLPRPGPRGPPTRARIARLLPGGGLHRIDHDRAWLHDRGELPNYFTRRRGRRVRRRRGWPFSGGSASATAASTAMLGGNANASAIATAGPGSNAGAANANSSATTINGNAAQANSTAAATSFGGGFFLQGFPQATATAQTNFGNFKSVQSTSTSSPSNSNARTTSLTTSAIAQAGGVVSPSNPIIPGQSFSVVSGSGFGPLDGREWSYGRRVWRPEWHFAHLSGKRQFHAEWWHPCA